MKLCPNKIYHFRIASKSTNNDTKVQIVIKIAITFCLVTDSFLPSFLNEVERMESTLVSPESLSLVKPTAGEILAFLFCSSWAALELDEAWRRGLGVNCEKQKLNVIQYTLKLHYIVKLLYITKKKYKICYFIYLLFDLRKQFHFSTFFILEVILNTKNTKFVCDFNFYIIY